MQEMPLERRIELHRRRRLIRRLRVAGLATALPLFWGGLTALLMLAVGSSLH